VTCIEDPLGLYLVLALIDLGAFLVPCAFRAQYSFLRTVLFSLNIALVVNVVFAVYVAPSYGISILTILTVVALGVLFYSLFNTFALLCALLLAIGAGMFTLQSFSQQWIENLLGVDYISMNVINFLLAASAVLTTVVFFLAKNVKFFGDIIDSVVYSVLAVFAIQYLKFFAYDNRSRSEWAGTNFFPDPSQLCCDDKHVECPIWAKPFSVLLFLGLFTVRLAIASGSEDVALPPPLGKDEIRPLVDRRVRTPS